MLLQQELEGLLKKKGIGPEGSKSLKAEELSRLRILLKSGETSLTTRATLLTALLTLPSTLEEQTWLEAVKAAPAEYLADEIIEFITGSDHPFLQLILKAIHHTDLTEAEAQQAMDFVFDPETPAHYIASFLESERLKRESSEENKVFFRGLFDRCRRIQVKQEPLIDICDNYDGCNRSKSFTLFTGALLAAAGFPTVIHGIDKVAPKEGYTHHEILQAAGKNPLLSLNEAAAHIMDPEIGWVYVDQQVFFPELYQFKALRKEMVKRPFLATFEKLLQPVQSTGGNYIVTGFTHSHYKQEVAHQLKEQGVCKKAIVLKGVEGSSHLSLSKSSICISYNGDSIGEQTVHPSHFGIPEMEQRQDRNFTALDSLHDGVAALKGEKNYAYQNMLFLALVILTQFNLIDAASETLSLLKSKLDDGEALKRWKKGNAASA